MQALEVAADGDGLGEMGAVVELDKRQAAGRILREHLGRAVFASEDVDLFRRDLESLFGYENSEPSRVRGASVFIYFHDGCDLKPVPRWRQPSIQALAIVGEIDCRADRTDERDCEIDHDERNRPRARR